MDRLECFGHRLDLQRLGNEIVARCQCGTWQQAVLLTDESALPQLVARVVGEHCRHVDGPWHPSDANLAG